MPGRTSQTAIPTQIKQTEKGRKSMTIIPPVPPTFAVQIIDGDTIISTTAQSYQHREAKKLLHRVQDSFPTSALAVFDEYDWTAIDQDDVAQAIFQHTALVLYTLTSDDLPPAHWALAPWQADKLEGTLHIRDLDQARKAIEAYAEVFGVTTIREETTEHAVRLRLDEVVWAGVRIELSTYTALPNDATVRSTELASADA